MPAHRFQSVEALRTIAATGVALYHFLLFSDGTTALFPGFEGGQTFFDLLRTSVLAFFTLTAVVIPVHFEQADYTLHNYPRFVLKRLLRVHIPFIAALLLIVFTQQVFRLSQEQGIAIDSFRAFANVTLTAEFFHVEWYNTIFWTLAIEMQFYLVIGLCFPLIKNYGIYGIAGLFLLGELLHFLWTDSRFFWHYTPYFTMGFLLWLYITGRLSPVVILLSAFAGSALVYYFHDTSAWLVFLLTPLLLLLLKNTPRFLSFAGRYTYSFYLVHGLAGGNFLYFSRGWGGESWIMILRVVLAFVVAFAASWLFFRVVEKFSMKLTHRIKYK